jgi:hypothetical protein
MGQPPHASTKDSEVGKCALQYRKVIVDDTPTNEVYPTLGRKRFILAPIEGNRLLQTLILPLTQLLKGL